LTSDTLIFLLVVGARFIIPLFIPRFPLPAVLAALVLDAADQTIFQNHTTLDLAGYQTYDKALDIYYLTIAFSVDTTLAAFFRMCVFLAPSVVLAEVRWWCAIV
jgi:hypothetical protein